MVKYEAPLFKMSTVRKMRNWIFVALAVIFLNVYVMLKQLSDANQERMRRIQSHRIKSLTKEQCKKLDKEQRRSYMECAVFEVADKQLHELREVVKEAKPTHCEADAIKSFLIVTTTTNGHYELVKYWLNSLQHLNYTKFLVVCFDNDVYNRLSVEKSLSGHLALIPNNWIIQPVSTSEELLFDTTSYNWLVNSRLVVICKLLENGYNIIFNGNDIVWLLTFLGNVALCRKFTWTRSVKRSKRHNAL